VLNAAAGRRIVDLFRFRRPRLHNRKEFSMKVPRLCFSVFVLALVASSMAQAQATRTWVSGVGDDVNPCSRTAPCKTFAGAISKTAAGGEIDALDPAGFGAVTIVKAITLDGGGGLVSSILVNGTNGVTVQAGPNDVVTLRNLSITGVGLGINGVRFNSGRALHIEHCSISSFTNHGIDVELSGGGQVFVQDTVSQDNAGSGLNALSTGTPVQVTVDNSRFDNNSVGVSALDFSWFAIRNSQAAGNSQVGFLAQANGGTAVMSIANSTAGNNAIGVQAGGGSAASSVRLAGVAVFLNLTGLRTATNGSIASFGNNYNSGSGTPSASIAQQ